MVQFEILSNHLQNFKWTLSTAKEAWNPQISDAYKLTGASSLSKSVHNIAARGSPIRERHVLKHRKPVYPPLYACIHRFAHLCLIMRSDLFKHVPLFLGVTAVSSNHRNLFASHISHPERKNQINANDNNNVIGDHECSNMPPSLFTENEHIRIADDVMVLTLKSRYPYTFTDLLICLII